MIYMICKFWMSYVNYKSCVSECLVMIEVALCKIWGSQYVEKTYIWVTDLFQKESEMRNRNSDHQIAFIATQNVY